MALLNILCFTYFTFSSKFHCIVENGIIFMCAAKADFETRPCFAFLTEVNNNDNVLYLYSTVFKQIVCSKAFYKYNYPWSSRCKFTACTEHLRLQQLIDSHPPMCPFYTWVRWSTCGISFPPRKIWWSRPDLNSGPLDPEAHVLPLDHRSHKIRTFSAVVYLIEPC